MAEEKKELTKEEKEKFLKNAKKVGLSAALTGLVLGGSGMALDNEHLKEYYKGLEKHATNAKKLKVAGVGVGAAGLATYGLAKYKHHKLKKQDDNSKK